MDQTNKQIAKGQRPQIGDENSLTKFHDQFVVDGTRYTVMVSRGGANRLRVHLNNSHVDTVARRLGDGGLLVQVCGNEGSFLLVSFSFLSFFLILLGRNIYIG